MTSTFTWFDHFGSDRRKALDTVKTESLLNRDRSVLFCGMTRATVRLDIISAA